MQETIAKLAEWVESISPHLWRIANKQVLVGFCRTIIGLVFTGSVATGCGIMLKKKIREEKESKEYVDNEGWCWVLGLVGGVALLTFSLVLFIELPKYLNWEYIAIQKLIELSPF